MVLDGFVASFGKNLWQNIRLHKISALLNYQTSKTVLSKICLCMCVWLCCLCVCVHIRKREREDEEKERDLIFRLQRSQM